MPCLKCLLPWRQGTVPCLHGNQPIFTCPVNVANGNGCGCNGGFNGFNN